MSYLVVITFDDAEQAAKVRKSLHSGEGKGRISLDDSAVIVKDAEGKMHVKNEMDRGVKIGAVGGSLLGLLLGGLLFPIGGLVLGGLAGAAIGKFADVGIDDKFVKEVGQELQPNTSAIFFIIRDADPNYALAALRQYHGKVYHTSLPSEAEENLRTALK